MFISIFIDFSAKFSDASVRAISASIAGFAAFVSFAACLFAFDALFYVSAAAFVAFSAVAVALELAFACVEANPWCCNSVDRVLRCQRRSRGFNSPQHRHGIGRSTAGFWFVRPKTRVRLPSYPPYLGVAQQKSARLGSGRPDGQHVPPRPYVSAPGSLCSPSAPLRLSLRTTPHRPSLDRPHCKGSASHHPPRASDTRVGRLQKYAPGSATPCLSQAPFARP